MKAFIQVLLLSVAISIALLTSIFGTAEIAGLLAQLSPRNQEITPQDVYGRVVLFLLGTFFIEILFERLTTFNKIDSIETEIRQINAMIKPVVSRFAGKHHRFYELLWKYVFRGAGVQEEEYSFTVKRGSSIDLWRDCISEADSWEALSYATDLWQNDEQEISQAHQDIHIKLGGHISRVFVFDNVKDLQEFQKDPNKQSIILSGNVRWILKKELFTLVEERFQQKGRGIELIDFAIANNNNYVLWFQLESPTKKLSCAVLTINDKIINQARSIFDIAYANSHKF